MERKLTQWSKQAADKLVLSKRFSRRSVRNQPNGCIDNQVVVSGENFPCNNIDFLSFVSLEELSITRTGAYSDTTIELADIWGWTTKATDVENDISIIREITIVCLTNGVSFIDNTDSLNPIYLAYLESNRPDSFWCDVKVYKDHAYIVKDLEGGRQNPALGVQIFDLTKLLHINITEAQSNNLLPVKVDQDGEYNMHQSAHNIIINPVTGFGYSVGSTDCNGGLHIFDLNKNLKNPEFVACIGDDGYVHDAFCVVYPSTAPDKNFHERELCFGFNEDTVTIYDVSDKSHVSIISSTSYPGATYTHQGWFTKDFEFLLVDDEVDELEGRVGDKDKTRTYVLDINDLRNPVIFGYMDHREASIDHNLYPWGTLYKHSLVGSADSSDLDIGISEDYAYLSNYVSGVRVLNIRNMSHGVEYVSEAGFFDVSPDLGGNIFEGAWSSFMFPSGVLAVSTIERGVYFLDPLMAFDTEGVFVGLPLSQDGPAQPTQQPGSPIQKLVVIISASFVAIVLVVVAIYVVRRRRQTRSIETLL